MQLSGKGFNSNACTLVAFASFVFFLNSLKSKETLLARDAQE